MLDEFIHEPRIAYFSMEIALRNEIPTYAGGLGVLAGDTMRSAADLELPMVAVSLASHAGYFRQEIDAQGRQMEHAETWDIRHWAQPLDAKIAVQIDGRTVWIGAWLYVLESHMGGRQPVLLLDTDLNENGSDDREITHYLYGGDSVYRLKQEIVLGLGGVRLLQALGFTIRHYHMNEGHSALLGLELMRRYTYSNEHLRPGEPHYDLPRVRDLCSFTTHTPVEAGHDRFAYDLVQRILDNDFDIETIRRLAGEESLNMTRLALNLSEYVNGVARKHAEISNAMFPDDGKTISQHFGRAPYYLILTIEEGKIVNREMRDKMGHNQFATQEHVDEPQTAGHGMDSASHDKHVSMAQAIADCKALLCGGMGMGAYESMRQLNIQPIVTELRDIEAVLAGRQKPCVIFLASPPRPSL